MNHQTTVRPCPLCATDNAHAAPAAWSQGDWRIKQCGTCRLVYLENPVTYGELEENFAWTRTRALECRRRRDAEPIFSRVSDACTGLRHLACRRNKAADRIMTVAPHGRVLDVGCGSGGILARLPETLVPFGIEIDRSAAAVAERRFRERGGRVIQAPALDGVREFDSEQFDCILLRSYLEHELQPLPVLVEVARLLTPEGRAIVKVPNFGCWNRRVRGNRWCGFRFPDHVNYFTPATLDAAIAAAGLRRVGRRWNDRLPTSDNMWAEVARDPAAETPARRAA